MGLAAAAGYSGWEWLRSRPKVDGVEWPIRGVLRQNENAAEAYFSDSHLAPTVDASKADPETLVSTQKKQNTRRVLDDSVRKIYRAGIFVHAGFIVGFDSEKAAMAEPMQRTMGGRLRYVSCLRFTPRESDGGYRQLRERAVLYVNGRLDRVVEDASDVCAGAVYAPFPELGKLTR